MVEAKLVQETCSRSASSQSKSVSGYANSCVTVGVYVDELMDMAKLVQDTRSHCASSKSNVA